MEKKKIISSIGLGIMAIALFLPKASAYGTTQTVFTNLGKNGGVSYVDLVLLILAALIAIAVVVANFVPSVAEALPKKDILLPVMTIISAWILLIYDLCSIGAVFSHTPNPIAGYFSLIGVPLFFIGIFFDQIASGFKTLANWIKTTFLSI